MASLTCETGRPIVSQLSLSLLDLIMPHTIAARLWCIFHGFSLLAESFNTASLIPLPSRKLTNDIVLHQSWRSWPVAIQSLFFHFFSFPSAAFIPFYFTIPGVASRIDIVRALVKDRLSLYSFFFVLSVSLFSLSFLLASFSRRLDILNFWPIFVRQHKLEHGWATPAITAPKISCECQRDFHRFARTCRLYYLH